MANPPNDLAPQERRDEPARGRRAIPAKLRLLLVEDDIDTARLLLLMLSDLGCETVWVGSVEAGLAAVAADRFDGAALDIRLGKRLVFPVADELSRQRIPFVFFTFYEDQFLSNDFSNAPVIPKPFVTSDVARAVAYLRQVALV